MTDEEYYEFIQPYEDAKQMLLTRLDVLNHNLYGDASARPIHNIQCRIKKKQSIEEKLQRKGKEPVSYTHLDVYKRQLITKGKIIFLQ